MANEDRSEKLSERLFSLRDIIEEFGSFKRAAPQDLLPMLCMADEIERLRKSGLKIKVWGNDGKA